MDQPLLQRTFTRWPLLAGGGGLLLVAALAYGCEGKRTTAVVEGDADTRDADRCSTRLESALDLVRPTSLGIVGVGGTLRNDPADAAAAFSEWLRQPDCRGAVSTEALSAEGKALLARLLGADGAAAIEADRLAPFDAAHVRDVLVDFAAAQRLTRDAGDDVDRATRIFEYVTRTVSAQGDTSARLPQSAYEAHLFGLGSAEERTLLFANLLRQVRLDAVVLTPGGEGGPWWVGVLLDDGVFLFDPEVGLPVPAPDAVAAAPTFLPGPATWAQAVEHPELLVSYRRDAGLAAEPIAAERLASVRVGLIGPPSFWKTVMERIELSVSGDRGVLLYDPLHDTEAGPGLYRRTADSGRSAWTEEAIEVWPYPAELEASRAALPSDQRQRLEQRVLPLLGPAELNVKTGQVEKRKALWLTRVEHMSGRAALSIVRYQFVRDPRVPVDEQGNSRLSPNDDSLNRLAADEAFYWQAQAQFDERRYATAATTLRNYLDRSGDRADEATALLALSLAADGKTAEAAEEAAKLPDETPGVARLRWLAGRWRGAAGPAAE